MGMISGFIDQWPNWISGIAGLISACAVLAAMTPSKSDDRIIGWLLRIINVVAINVGKARNADDKK